MAVRLARQGRNVAIVTIDNQANRGGVHRPEFWSVCGLNDEAFAVQPRLGKPRHPSRFELGAGEAMGSSAFTRSDSSVASGRR